MTTENEILFEEMAGLGGSLGIITLNRPNVLNSLNYTMVKAMYDQLSQWGSANHIKAVVIRAAEGRAFCAGGDLRLTYDKSKKNDSTLLHFFHDEYLLNRLIFHFPKPYIALLNGITMGGGVGISIHGSHRVATDRLLFAMPETGIGFFPDVGGSYFLPRLRGFIGFYAGLTGIRMNSDDCVALGIATQKVTQESLPELIRRLAEEPFSDDAKISVTRIIESFSLPKKPSLLVEQQPSIDACFSKDTMEDILLALKHAENEICKEAAIMIPKKSPTSLKVTLQAMQLGKHFDFDACMRQEYRLVSRFLQGHDFFEGIRSVIIDKDQSPNWRPSTINEVSAQQVEKYFAPLIHELA